mgnify:CR=1 FL=1
MYLDLWGLVGGLVHWLMVDIVGTILNWLHLYGLADWLGSPGVLHIVTILVVALIILIVGMLVAITLIWQERKMLGRFMDRVGTQVGPFGLFQNFADAFKVLVKEYIVPDAADRLIYPLAPILIIGVSMAMFVTIPYSQGFYMSDSDLSVILTLAMFGVIPFAVLLGGWASNNKYSLYGAIRAASQAISYEIALGLCLLAVILVTGSLSLREIAGMQHGMNWNVFYQPVGFILFFVCALAECNRTPFDLPETEAELVVGYMTEYGSMKMGLYMFAEYVNMFISSAIMATLYFGAYNYPGMDFVREFLIGQFGEVAGHNIATLVGTGVLFLKIFMFIFTFMWIRWTLPRFKYEQLMRLGWQWMVPLAMVNLVIMALATLSGKPLLVAWIGMGAFLLIYYGGRTMYEKRLN